MTTISSDRASKWALLHLLIVGALTGAIGCASKPKAPVRTTNTPPPMAEPETRPFRACQADSDCVYVQNGCCDCGNGGGAIAVHRNKVAEFNAAFDCATSECTAKLRMPGCETGTAACTAGLCEYTLK